MYIIFHICLIAWIPTHNYWFHTLFIQQSSGKKAFLPVFYLIITCKDDMKQVVTDKHLCY